MHTSVFLFLLTYQLPSPGSYICTVSIFTILSPRPEITKKVILELNNRFALGQPQHNPTPASKVCLDLINSSVLVNCE